MLETAIRSFWLSPLVPKTQLANLKTHNLFAVGNTATFIQHKKLIYLIYLLINQILELIEVLSLNNNKILFG